MTGLEVILVIGVLALGFGCTVLERRINALKSDIDELRRQIRAVSEAEGEQEE